MAALTRVGVCVCVQAKPFDYEHSEMLLYQNEVLVESGAHADALAHLTRHDAHLVDRVAADEARAQLMLRAGRHADAAAIYGRLVDRNPANWIYYRGLEDALQPGRWRHWWSVGGRGGWRHCMSVEGGGRVGGSTVAR